MEIRKWKVFQKDLQNFSTVIPSWVPWPPCQFLCMFWQQVYFFFNLRILRNRNNSPQFMLVGSSCKGEHPQNLPSHHPQSFFIRKSGFLIIIKTTHVGSVQLFGGDPFLHSPWHLLATMGTSLAPPSSGNQATVAVSSQVCKPSVIPHQTYFLLGSSILFLSSRLDTQTFPRFGWNLYTQVFSLSLRSNKE